MSLRSRSHVKTYIMLMRAGHLFIQNYIRSLLNIILIPILISQRDLHPQTNTCLFVLFNLPCDTGSNTIIHIICFDK